LGCNSSNLFQNGECNKIYELKRRIRGTSQCEWFLATYFHQPCALWWELDHYQIFQDACAANAVKFQQLVEDGQIYEFLVGLNSKYDQVRVKILRNEPLPSLQEMFVYIHYEESRRGAMLHSSSQEL